MYILAIGWLYVALMMALAEASSGGMAAVLGSIATFMGYGVLPVGLLLYVLRPRPLRQRPPTTTPASDGVPPDTSCHAPRAAEPNGITPMGKEN